MIETLYKTDAPEKDKSECYVLVLASRAGSDGRVYAFMEEHGLWNDDLQRFLYQVKSINADEGLTYQRASGLYDAAKRSLATKGFVHSFRFHSLHKEPCSDEVPELETATA